MSNSLGRMTVFKAKNSVKKFEAIFDTPVEPLPKFEYEASKCKVEGVVKFGFIGGDEKTHHSYPWVTMLKELSDDLVPNFKIKNRTPWAVIGVKITPAGKESRFFLITFGMHTSRFVNSDRILNDFGIKVAMNICDQNCLKKVNTTTHSSISTLTDRQASKGTSLDIFDIDDEKEFFRSIAGNTYEDYPFINSFSGRSSITVNLKKGKFIDNENLVEILLSLEKAYDLKSYKDKFPTYGRLDYVSDNDDVSKLDDKLFDKIRNKNLNNIYLSPDFILSDEFSYFSYVDPNENKNAIKYDELDIDTFLSYKKIRDNSSAKTLKNWKIYGVDNIGGEDKYFSMHAYNCLHCELEIDGTFYILSSGIWRSVGSDFKNEIDDYLKLKISNNPSKYLPNNISIHTSVKEKDKYVDRYKEETYNSHAANNNKNLFLFDKSKILIGNEKRYEICDLLHINKELIHVKLFKNSSSSLSHLFLQARFYTDAFVKDVDTRSSMIDFINNNNCKENLNKNIKEYLDIIKEERKELQETTFSILLCILSFDQSLSLDKLPFMARYELVKTHSYLKKERGIDLSYTIKTVNKVRS
ncbi:DUF6119 family protein [Vibrio sp. TRT 21S02]|uniref:DUF6119 family protein n=1 Tax=Vibrio sp. TRT 21S02 TaxID=3418507 RepID=UPI003CEB2163